MHACATFNKSRVELQFFLEGGGGRGRGRENQIRIYYSVSLSAFLLTEVLTIISNNSMGQHHAAVARNKHEPCQ